MTRIACIKQYFADSSRTLENREIVELTKEDRVEIGNLCADALSIPEADREWLHEQGAAA